MPFFGCRVNFAHDPLCSCASKVNVMPFFGCRVNFAQNPLCSYASKVNVTPFFGCRVNFAHDSLCSHASKVNVMPFFGCCVNFAHDPLCSYASKVNVKIQRVSSIGSVFAWHASGPEFDPHIRHILSSRLGHEYISRAILPLPLIQEEQLSVTGERMCTKYW